MNHDSSHCADWDDKKCPKTCYRAKLTKELKENPVDYWQIPRSFVHFMGTQYCKREQVKMEKGEENG